MGAKNERCGRSQAKFRGLENFTASARRFFGGGDKCDITDSQATIKAIYGNIELDKLTIGEKRINLNDANITQGNSKTIRLK